MLAHCPFPKRSFSTQDHGAMTFSSCRRAKALHSRKQQMPCSRLWGCGKMLLKNKDAHSVLPAVRGLAMGWYGWVQRSHPARSSR